MLVARTWGLGDYDSGQRLASTLISIAVEGCRFGGKI